VIRALEVKEICGKEISKIWSGCFFNSLPTNLATFVFVRWEKNLLTERIKKRILGNFDEWVLETKKLLSMNYPKECPALKSLGYPQIMDFIDMKLSRKEAIDKIIKLTLAYAKRQNTWFSRYKNIKRIVFFEKNKFIPEKTAEEIIESGCN